MAAITYRGVSKRYGASVALADLNLAVADGELVVLVGPSGCGKSTALRLLAGLETPSAGELLLDGQAVNDWPPARRNLAMVFQDYALYPHMTVRGNLAFPLKMAGLKRSEIAARVTRTAELLQLGPLLERRPGQLSGGQRQRVAMGRALVREPRAFLLDEPLSNLDAKLRVQIRAEIAALQRRLGATMLYVTHDQVEAMTLGQRVAVLERGRLQQVGPPMALYRRPANLFVAGFLGNPGMNLFPARGEDRGGLLHLVAPGLVLPLPGVPVWLAGRVAWAGVRPEAVTLAPPRTGAAAVRVTAVENLGHEMLLYLDAPWAADRPFCARSAGTRPAGAGETLSVGLGAADLYLFDETGRALWPAGG